MISQVMRSDIETFFPEIGFSEFLNRFAVPCTMMENMTLATCKELDFRVISIANDLSIQMSIEEEKANHKEKIINKVKNEAIHSCARNREYIYEDISNFSNGKNAMTNTEYRESFADLVVARKIEKGELEDPSYNRSRAQILRNLWFSITEIGKRIDNWSLAESTRIKRMKDK